MQTCFRSPRRFRSARCLVLAALIAVSWRIESHPHAWIDLHVNLTVNEDRQLTAIQQTWRFDPIYTSLLIEELEAEDSDADRESRLQAMGQRMIRSMADYNYLTHITHGDAQVSPSSIDGVRVQVTDEGRLEFRFTLLLDTTPELTQGTLQYMIYDPMYYIEMMHPAPSAIRIEGAPECRVDITDPEPDASEIARAAAVDVGSAEADGLGRHFAQRVSLSCP